MMRSRILIYVGTLVILFVTSMVISQLTFLTNLSLVSTAAKTRELSFQNAELSIDLSRAEALDPLIARAHEMGFIEASRVFYLNATTLSRQ